jgi:hypothetical protein
MNQDDDQRSRRRIIATLRIYAISAEKKKKLEKLPSHGRGGGHGKKDWQKHGA